jgi:hypothetical protein
MVNTECSTDSRKPTLVPVTAEDEATPLCHGSPDRGTVSGDRATTGSAPTDTCARKRQAVAGLSRWRRFDRVSIGFWLGGATLGTGGCILGACMPYHHPVGIAISVIWWGIYLGCFGASLGACDFRFRRAAPLPKSDAPLRTWARLSTEPNGSVTGRKLGMVTREPQPGS